MSRTRHVLHHLRHPRALALRLLRVPCGAYGGIWGDPDPRRRPDAQGRWCIKPFGHCDSHCYEHDTHQPLVTDRRRAQGHRP